MIQPDRANEFHTEDSAPEPGHSCGVALKSSQASVVPNSALPWDSGRVVSLTITSLSSATCFNGWHISLLADTSVSLHSQRRCTTDVLLVDGVKCPSFHTRCTDCFQCASRTPLLNRKRRAIMTAIFVLRMKLVSL